MLNFFKRWGLLCFYHDWGGGVGESFSIGFQSIFFNWCELTVDLPRQKVISGQVFEAERPGASVSLGRGEGGALSQIKCPSMGRVTDFSVSRAISRCGKTVVTIFQCRKSVWWR